MAKTTDRDGSVAILGAGITGLTAAYFLQHRNYLPLLIERDKEVGGLAKTVEYRGFKFDLGGHRFLTDNAELERFVKNLLNERYLVVNRTSNIYLNNRYIKYPLQPWNAFRHVGIRQSLSFLSDYIIQKTKFRKRNARTLEEWVVQRFGNSLYEVFFKGYSEKVWGLDCTQIDSDWIAQRIQNLNLSRAIKSSISKRTSKNYATLTDKFLYPADGIGSITDNLCRRLDSSNVRLEANVQRICHNGKRITSIEYKQQEKIFQVEPEKVISTIPLSVMVKCLDPKPPSCIIETSNRLRSRDLLLVTLMVDCPKVSNDSWIYFPEKHVPFGRIHEPKNWSNHMAPAGKTAVVTEHFCFRGDATWSAPDSELVQRTVDSMCELGFMQESELIDAVVVRIANAYPLFETGYRKHCETLFQYLDQFQNLDLAGRTGAFRYYNMDHAMLSGIEAVERLTGEKINLANYGIAGGELVNQVDPTNGEPNEMCPDYSGLAT